MAEPRRRDPWYARKPPWWLVALILLLASALLIAIQGPNARF